MKRIISRAYMGIFVFLQITLTFAQQPWQVSSYPDETGFIRRTAGAIEQISRKNFGKRSLALSTCPDTGLPVHTWAVEGEEIISPYTGRRYKQGPTGYFGPKQRDENGEITAFGGDPLKYELDPATATLLLNPEHTEAKAFLGVWGNMIQQYHFGACNWARFYGLCSEYMSPEWNKRFQQAVGQYAESRRPSDGAREHDPLPRPYNLVGFPDEKEGVLGGGFANGGTENHKTMWRTSALVYADLFPEDAQISGFSIKNVKELVPAMFTDFFRKTLQVGNGEYDSHIYYPHSIYGFLNLYDFAQTPEYREMAKFMIDYYLATYRLKCVDNTIAGAQKRGYLSELTSSEMETLMWTWTGQGSKDMQQKEIHLHQATSSYRPNRILYNILSNRITYPFEAKIARPSYHMNIPNVFQESFYRSHSFALGNVAMTIVDNPNQQVVWSLVAEGKKGPLCFGGQQPYRLSPQGHSQYTQTMQHRKTIILMTAQTGKKPFRELTGEEKSRFEHAAEKLRPLVLPAHPTMEQLMAFFDEAKMSAASWLYIPKQVDQVIERNKHYFVEANQTFIHITPLGDVRWIAAADSNSNEKINVHKYLAQYHLLSVHGEVSGYIIEVAEKNEFNNLEAFIKASLSKKQLKSFNTNKLISEYETLDGDRLKMQYVNTALRARAWINNQEVDYDNWNDGYVYFSPFVKTKDGVMYVTDGKEGYKVDYTGDIPKYSEWNE